MIFIIVHLMQHFNSFSPIRSYYNYYIIFFHALRDFVTIVIPILKKNINKINVP